MRTDDDDRTQTRAATTKHEEITTLGGNRQGEEKRTKEETRGRIATASSPAANEYTAPAGVLRRTKLFLKSGKYQEDSRQKSAGGEKEKKLLLDKIPKSPYQNGKG